MLLKIVRDVLGKLGLKIVKARRVQEHGVDIIARDNKGDFVSIELKAYNKYEAVKPKNIEQLKNSLKRENIKRGMLIATTSKIKSNMKVPNNIRIILFDEFSNLCKPETKTDLEFIRNYSVHIETEEKEAKRKKIINFIREESSNGRKIKIDSINKKFRIDFYSYFNNFYDAIKKSGIDMKTIEIRRIRNKEQREEAKRALIEKILKFIEDESKKGYYPTSVDIKKKFGITHVWNYVRMSDLYRKLNLPPYLERGGRYHRG